MQEGARHSVSTGEIFLWPLSPSLSFINQTVWYLPNADSLLVIFLLKPFRDPGPPPGTLSDHSY